MSDAAKYNLRGVSANKNEVHKAIKNLDKGLFPNAFCQIYPDYLGNDDDYCTIMHADGAGTKSILAYMYWKETGDASVWAGIAQDSIVMNLDDMLCAGARGPFMYSSTLGRNKGLIPGEIIAEIVNGSADFFKKMKGFGLNVHFMGGETADLGDLVRTVVVDGTMTARLKRSEVVDNANIKDGDVIVGLASYGQATYETEYNSGIASNGLTSARHDVLHKYLGEKYPESFDPNVPSEVQYCGSKKLTDIDETTGIEIGKLILSPTRTYAPIALEVFEKLGKNIHGMIHCTGGAQTKVLKFVNNKHIIKDNLFDMPPLFKLIQEESKTDWKEMYQVFNMGHRLEYYVSEESAQTIIDIAQSFNVDAKIVGRVQEADKNRLTIRQNENEFIYD